MLGQDPSHAPSYRSFDTYAREPGFVVADVGASCATPASLGPLVPSGGPLAHARLLATNQLLGRLGDAWLVFDAHGLHVCTAETATCVLEAPIVSAVLVGDDLAVVSTPDGLSVVALRSDGGGAITAGAARAVHIADRSLGRLGPFWVIEDAAREAEASSRLLLALSCYGQRSCRVHCCLLELHALQAPVLTACAVPCLVGTVRPLVVAVCPGLDPGAARLLLVAAAPFDDLAVAGEPEDEREAHAEAEAAAAAYLTVLAGADCRTCVSYAVAGQARVLGAWREQAAPQRSDGGGAGDGGGSGGGGDEAPGGVLCVAVRRGHYCEVHHVPLRLGSDGAQPPSRHALTYPGLGYVHGSRREVRFCRVAEAWASLAEADGGFGVTCFERPQPGARTAAQASAESSVRASRAEPADAAEARAAVDGSCVLGLRLDNHRLAVLRSRSLHIFGRGEGRAQPSTAHAPPGAADGAATMPSPQSAALQKALAQLEADTDGDW